MSISLYDLLDVDETASTDEIKAAWKAAIADLDPTDRRFRAYNDAAAVLLDGDKRTAYDAELAAARGEDDAAAPAEAEAEEAPPRFSAPATSAETAAVAEPAAVPEPTLVPGTEPVVLDKATASQSPGADADDAQVETDEAAPRARRDVPTWALFLAGGLAVLSAVLMIVVLTWPGSLGGDSPRSAQDDEASAESAGRAAEDTATRAVPVVLSYDYRTLDQDFADAAEYLTDDFAQQRNDLFAQKPDGGKTLREQVVDDKVVVDAIAPAAGLTRVSPDGDAATVVVYVNQESHKGKSAPRTLQMWATLSMVNQDGNWLIDDICTEDDCS